MSHSTFRIRVQKAAGAWRWRCRNTNGWVHDLGSAPNHPEALRIGLLHFDLYHTKGKP